MNDGTRPSSTQTRGRNALLAALCILALGLLQLMPLLDQIDFHHEEGRRVLPAREMISSGDWIVPTIWERPYLSKPPGIFWLLGGTFKLLGEVSAWNARLLSVAATLITLVALFAVGRRLYGLRAGIYAALLFLGSSETLTKGRLAEIEAPLACCVFLAISCWWFGRSGARTWLIAAGVFLAAAILLKGPAALIFFLGPPLALACFEGRPASLLSARLLAPLAIGLVLPSLWMLALFNAIDAETATSHWGGQIGGQGGRSLAMYTAERLKFLPGSVLACLPASLILIVSVGTQEWKRLRTQDATGFALAAVASGWLFFLVFPGTSVRYFYPAMPLLALLGGALLVRVHEPSCSTRYARRIDHLAGLFSLLGLLVFLVAVVGHFVQLGDVQVDSLGLVLATLLLALALGAWNASGSRRHVLAFLALPLVIGQLIITQVESAKAERHSREPYARRIDAELTPTESLHVCFWSDFDTLLYLQHEVQLEQDWRSLPAGAAALVRADQYTRMSEELGASGGFEELLQLRIRRSELVLVRMGHPPGLPTQSADE